MKSLVEILALVVPWRKRSHEDGTHTQLGPLHFIDTPPGALIGKPITPVQPPITES